jgi:hypothetical protein
MSELGAIMKGVAAALRPLFKDINERLDKLEARTVDFKYCGVHEAGREYRPGNVVTCAGAMWHANTATRDRPGQSNAWTLCVKSGDR